MDNSVIGENGVGERFGCEHCWPPMADAAWGVRGELTREDELIDESHFHVMILSCRSCSQRFVSVFTEVVDWADGDDSQYWAVLPITDTEASDLLRQGQSLGETAFNALGEGRRCLRRDYPKGSAPCCYWGTGISVGPHD